MDSQNKNSALFKTVKLGSYEMNNRIVMAPLTRCRADYSTGVPNDLHVQYYTERAQDAAFVITECAPVSRRAACFPGAGGIYTDDQVEGWKNVTESVHKVGGKIFLQIWHCGRAAKAAWLNGEKPLCPSAVKNRHPARTEEYDEPQEMTTDDIKEVLNQFKKGAQNAKKAGFDGIELHGANGYLVDEFLRDGVNKRTDDYGGSIENRCRFPLEIMDILIEEFGSDKVGIKVTPVGRFNDMFDSDPLALYSYFLKELDRRKVAFVEISKAPEFRAVPNYYGVSGEEQIPDVYAAFRKSFSGIIIANNGFDFDSANKVIESGNADMVSFGRLFIANPDLVKRFENGYKLNTPNESTFYTPGAVGYIDYPKYQ